jgi:hypothetical protein
LGIEGLPDKVATPNDPANTVKDGSSLAQNSPVAATAAAAVNSEKSEE